MRIEWPRQLKEYEQDGDKTTVQKNKRNGDQDRVGKARQEDE